MTDDFDYPKYQQEESRGVEWLLLVVFQSTFPFRNCSDQPPPKIKWIFTFWIFFTTRERFKMDKYIRFCEVVRGGLYSSLSRLDNIKNVRPPKVDSKNTKMRHYFRILWRHSITYSNFNNTFSYLLSSRKLKRPIFILFYYNRHSQWGDRQWISFDISCIWNSNELLFFFWVRY